MKPIVRMSLFVAGGLAVALMPVVTSRWGWPWAEHTTPGNIAYVVGRLLPAVTVAVLVGYFTRPRAKRGADPEAAPERRLDAEGEA